MWDAPCNTDKAPGRKGLLTAWQGQGRLWSDLGLKFVDCTQEPETQQVWRHRMIITKFGT